MKNILESKIRNVVRQILNEEQGINHEVYDGANRVLLLIRNDGEIMWNNEEYDDAFDGNAYVVRGEFPFTFAEEEITVVYNSYIFQDQETYRSYVRKYPKMLKNATSVYSKDNCQIFVVYNYIEEDGYDESIYDRVQHELEHIFQEIQKNGTFPSSDLKDVVNSGLGMKIKEPNIFKASFILYCSRQYEQDACANGLYNWLQNGTTDKDSIVRDSALVRNRRICLKYINELETLMNIETEKNKISSFFGMTLEKILKKGCNACVRMKNKANRTIFKYNTDTENKVSFI